MAASKKGGLGRGLDALFADAVPVAKTDSIAQKPAEKPAAETKETGESVRYLSIHDVKPNANQPRKSFDEEKIAELADSIRENGIIQPIIVSHSMSSLVDTFIPGITEIASTIALADMTISAIRLKLLTRASREGR